MRFLQGNFHLVWTIPFAVLIAIAFKSPMLFLILTVLECFSLGIHQYVHHDKQFLGRLTSLEVLGATLSVLILIAWLN